MLWARWFLEGIVDPDDYRTGSLQLPSLYASVSRNLDSIGMPKDSQGKAIRRRIAELLWGEVLRRRAIGPRAVDYAVKASLWEEAGPSPRCWICGYLFPPWARTLSLYGSPRSAPLPAFLDFYRPQGKHFKDLSAEVEHVGAYSRGGGDEGNLRLSCGWCNRAKSNWGLLHEVPVTPRLFSHPRLGEIKIPQPFWVVRRLALVGRCETLGCSKTTASDALTVCLRHRSGSPTPLNLQVTCAEHDTFDANDRMVARTVFA
jgi:hypothetical protein